jgi:hypothetical protein
MNNHSLGVNVYEFERKKILVIIYFHVIGIFEFVFDNPVALRCNVANKSCTTEDHFTTFSKGRDQRPLPTISPVVVIVQFDVKMLYFIIFIRF